MNYQLPTNNIQTLLKELNLIRRGIHATVKGGIGDADGYLFMLALKKPILARAIANRLDYATYVDFNILRVKAFANQIRADLRIIDQTNMRNL
jgi:hypothetical protein